MVYSQGLSGMAEKLCLSKTCFYVPRNASSLSLHFVDKLFFKLLMHDRAEVNSKEVTRTHKLPTNQGAALALCCSPPESLAPELIQAAAGVWGGPLAAEPHIMKRPVKAVLLDAQKISIQVATWERAASLKLLSSPRTSGGRSFSLSVNPLRWEVVTCSPLHWDRVSGFRAWSRIDSKFFEMVADFSFYFLSLR